MCGIAGFAGPDPDVIERMTRCLVHRGPDGNAIWRGECASLGHARLAILDPRPEGDQPMWNGDRTIAIVFNGEIYNYRDLREKEQLSCRTNTDTEVLLRLYEKHGMNFLPMLQGMFAFGMYDVRSNTWHLARDHKGIKPLFVAYPQGKLAFASEMRALMAAMPVKPALNMRSLSLYLRLQHVPGPETLCEGIENVPPGTIITWQDGRESRSHFAPIENKKHIEKYDFQERFPSIMDKIVRQHLIADKPIGIFLSGGMDSSILLHHMSKNTDKPINTFTVRFEATDEEGSKRFNTDADLARLTAQHYGTVHHEVLLTADSYREHYRDTARALDQPNADSVSVAQYLLAYEAKKYVDVVLTGAGGDELFGGYPRYRIARVLNALRFVPPRLRSLVGQCFGYPGDVLALKPGPVLAERLLARPIDECMSVVKNGWFDSSATTFLFRERFERTQTDDSIRMFMEFDRALWLVDESLRLTDATTMASGVEARVPFVDEHIISAAHGVPASWHVGMRRTKALLKETYRPLLPQHLYTLPKASFYPPLAKWLRRECHALADEMLEHTRISELFETNILRTMLQEHTARTRYHLHALSSLIQLSHWFDEVYDA